MPLYAQSTNPPPKSRGSFFKELTICAALVAAFEIACIGAFVVALLVLGTVPWI